MNQQTEYHDRDVVPTARPLLSRQTGQLNIGEEEIVLVDFLPTRFTTHYLRVDAVEPDSESAFGGSTDSPPHKLYSHQTTASAKKHKKNKKKSKQSKFHAWGSSASLHLSSRSFFESSGSTLSSISEEPLMEAQQQERSHYSGVTRSRMMDSIGLEDDALPKNAQAIGCGVQVHPWNEKATWGAAPWDFPVTDDADPYTMDDCCATSRCGGSSVLENQSTEFTLWPSFVAMETPPEITVVNDAWSVGDEQSERDGESAHNLPIVRPGTFRKREPQVTTRRRSKDTAAGPSLCPKDIPTVCSVACPLTPVSDASTTELECSPSSFGSTSATPKMRTRKLPSRTFHRLAMTLPWRRSLVSCEVSTEE